MVNHGSLKIGIVAGEASGDILGAGLIYALRKRNPHIEFEGIGGPLMIEAGCKTLYPMERLAIMGLTEVLGRLKELLGIRKALVQHFAQNKPDVFIGIDAPDFNLTLEQRLKEAGIPTVHYVSPSVWAWRQQRVKKIAKATNHLLALFPFEVAFYEAHHVPVTFVGHPLADEIPMNPDKVAARLTLTLPLDKTVVALLPGSRMTEVKKLARLMFETAQWCRAKSPQLVFIVPAANARVKTVIEQELESFPELAVRVFDGQSRLLMQASDVILLASGTATLEAMLMKRPMVVTYRLSPLTYWIMRRMAKIKNVALPNLLANETLVPELLQDDAQPERLGEKILDFLNKPDLFAATVARFDAIHLQLKKNASEVAAEQVLRLVSQKC